MSIFRRIRGQDRALATLRRALASGKVPHAYLFAGPAGVGKSATAIALASALNCETEPGEGCGACPACERIAAGNHPDVLTIRPSGAGNFIVVGEIRDLTSRLGFAPHEGRARLVVVEDAERLKVEAANAFLKTLEEPPARTHFVLVSAAPEQLLSTVRSRCQRVRFTPLPADAIAAILTDSGVDAAQAREAAIAAGGSAHRAAELADGEVLARRRERVARVRAAAAAPGWKPIFDAASELAQDKDDLRPTLELLALWYRDAAATAAGLPPEALVHRDHAEEMRAEAGRASSAALARRAAAVLKAQEALVGFANPQLTLERMILALREA